MASAAVAVFTWVVKAGTNALMAVGVSKGAAYAASTFAVKTLAMTAASAALTALMQPKVNAYGAPSEFRSDPNGPIPFLAGRRGIGGIGVDDKAFGADNRYRGIITVLSGGGPIDGFETLYASRAAVTFGGANGAASSPPEFAGKMFFQATPGNQPQGAALAQPGLHQNAVMPGWGAHRRMSGKAHHMLTLYQDSKFQSFPVLPEWLSVGRGLRGWDPRLDSTYPGGSGPCRLDDPSTHVYIKRPGLWALKWALGIHENGKLVGGLGRSVSEIAVDTLVELENVCEANGWEVAAWPTTRDDPHEVFKAFLQAGGARYAEFGGKIGCIPRKPRVSVAVITAADTDGPLEIDTSPPAQDLLNTVYPSCVLESHFWKTVPLDPVTVPQWVEDDGEVLDAPLEMDWVPFAKQASEIAAYIMADSREPIRMRIPVKPYLRKVKPGNIVTLSEDGFILNGVDFLVLDRDTDPDTGRVFLWLESESEGKHAFALGQTTTPPTPPEFSAGNPWIAPAPTGDEWTIQPVQLQGPDGSAQPGIRISGGTERTNVTRLHVWYQEAPVDPEAWRYWAPLLPSEFGAGIEITGLAPQTEYFIRLGYENDHGVISPENWFISGPWMTGGLIAQDAVAPSAELAAARDVTAAGFQTLAEAKQHVANLTGGISGLTQAEAIEQGYEVLRQSGVQNLILMSGDEGGDVLWRLRQSEARQSFTAHDGYNGVLAEREASAAGQKITLYLARADGRPATIPWTSRARAQVAVFLALEGVASDPRVRLVGYDYNGDPLSSIDLTGELEAGRYGGFLEPGTLGLLPLFPPTFAAGAPNPDFTASNSGSPTGAAQLTNTSTREYVADDPVFGPAWIFGNGTSTSSLVVSPRDVLAVEPGKIWEVSVTARVMDDGAGDLGARLRLRLRPMDEDYAADGTTPYFGGTHSYTVASGVVTLTRRIGAPDVNPALVDVNVDDVAFLRPQIVINGSGSRAGRLVIGEISVKDVSDLSAVNLARVGLEVEVSSSGEGDMAFEASRPLFGMALPAQQEVAPWQPGNGLDVRRIVQQKLADIEQARVMLQAEFLAANSEARASIALEAAQDTAAAVLAASLVMGETVLADALTQLKVSGEANAAGITAVAEALTAAVATLGEEDEALGQALSLLTGRVEETEDGISALGSSLSSTQAQVGALDAITSILQESFIDTTVTPNVAKGIIAIITDVNGRVSGIINVNNGVTGEIDFVADTVRYGGIQMFSGIDGGLLVAPNIRVEHLAADVVEAENVVSNSIARTYRFDGSASGEQSVTTSGIVLGEVSGVTLRGGALDVLVQARMGIASPTGSGLLQCRFIIVEDNGAGSTVYSKTLDLTASFSGARDLDYRTIGFSVPASAVPTGSNYYLGAALLRTHSAGTLAIKDNQLKITEDATQT